MVDAIEAQKTKIEVSPDDGANWTAVKGITGISGLDGEAGDIDVSTLDSDAKEFLTGLADEGTISLSGNYLPEDPGQEMLRAARLARTIRDFRITFSNGTTGTFKGNVKTASFDASVDTALAGAFSIKISGVVTLVNP